MFRKKTTPQTSFIDVFLKENRYVLPRHVLIGCVNSVSIETDENPEHVAEILMNSPVVQETLGQIKTQLDLVKSDSTLKNIFPKMKSGRYSELAIDRESLKYISYSSNAEYTTKLITFYMAKLNMEPGSCAIVDTNGGFGGNTISFAFKFEHVFSIEFDTIRSIWLQNNVDLYDLQNVTVMNDDSAFALGKIKTDVVFMDPPWGGSNYKLHTNLRLNMGAKPIEFLTHETFANGTMLVCLKLPMNYDFGYISREFIDYDVSYHPFRKKIMLVVIMKKLHEK